VSVLHRMAEEGHGRSTDIATLHDIYNQMAGNCFCLLGESAVTPIRSALKLFPHEFEEMVQAAAANATNGRVNGKHAIRLEAVGRH
jgi:NADH-quinone oxidoreductase subunit F